MSLTFTEARDEILTLINDAWIANSVGVPIKFWDKADDFPSQSTNAAWADVRVQWFGGNQRGFGRDQRRYTRSGIVTVRIFTPFGDGLSQSDSLVKVAADAFEGVDTPNGVWFTNVRVNTVGHDGEWFQTNVLADFQYDEVK